MNRNRSRTENTFRNLMTSLICFAICVLIKFINRTVFVYTLGKPFLGISGLFSDILVMLSLTELGIDTAINFKLYKPLAENDITRIQVIMGFYKYAYFLVGIAMLILGGVMIPLLPWVIKDYDTLEPLGINPIVIFLLYVFQSATSYLFFAYRSAILKADQKEYIVTITNTMFQIVQNFAQILVLFTVKNFTLYVASVIIFGICQNIVNSIIAQKKYPDVFKKNNNHITKDELRDTFKDLGAVFASKINTVALKATDNIVLSAFVGLIVVGTYSNYLLFYTTIKMVLQRVYNATKASMGDLFAESDKVKKYKFFNLMNYITIILYGTSAVGVTVMADEVIECWLGTTYVIAQPLSLLLGIEIVFMGIKQNLTQIRNVAGLFRQMWFRPILGVIINVGLSVILVQIWGIYGVLIGTISADIITNFLMDPKIIYKYGFEEIAPVSEYYFRNIRYLIELIVLGIIDAVICHYIVLENSWLTILIHMIVCGLSVPGYMYIAYRKNEEVKYIGVTVGKIKRKITKKMAL